MRPKAWTCSCWYADADGTYLELTGDLPQGAVIERQLFLSSRKRFALLMDSVRSGGEAKIAYQASIPLATSVMSRADFVSREWRLHSGSFSTRVLPISLDFDRVQSTPGTCAVEDEALRLQTNGVSATNFSVMLDWHPKRSELPAEWTRLTVTEARRAVDLQSAAAYRVRIGSKHQIVTYKSLNGSRELRTVLGQHTGRDSFVGRLKRGGAFEPLVLVDFGDEQ